MTKRVYTGPAIDASWDDPKWMGDGDTVDVIDAEGDGEVSVDLDGDELFPEPWEPTEDQVARARWILLNTDMTGGELADRAGTTRSHMSEVINGRHAVNPNTPPPIMFCEATQEYRPKSELEEGGPALDNSDIIKIREELVAGAGMDEVADQYDLHRATVRQYANGNKTIDPDEIQIEYDGPVRGWIRTGDGTDEPNERTHPTSTREQPDTDGTGRVAVVVGFIIGVLFSAGARRLTRSE